LLAGLTAEGPVTVHYPAIVRDHTERLLDAMGATIERQGLTTRLVAPVKSLRAPADRLEVPGDFSSAAFLVGAALAVAGSAVSIRAVGLNPGRTGLLDALRAMGATATTGAERRTSTGEPVGDLDVAFGSLEAIDLPTSLVPRMIDELPLLAVLACLAAGTTRIRGAAELRLKECDRLAAMAAGLSRLGARVEELPDGLDIEGPSRLVGTTVDGHADHRVVMALAVAGLAAEGTTFVRGADAVADSYPEFAASVNALGMALAA
jgi:3-phosphoshikimate 1-carboxyvinyltransferase